ncbi:hypothetical protein Barb7_01403 [Bacteroidales bacterium Barb7]|nr:hypothetical protein Barb7_01403 [Bacteroidales bacterium Barb7]
MLRRNPEGMIYFSPTWSAAECGVNGDADKEVLKGRPNNIYCIANHRLQLVSFFQNFIDMYLPTPHSSTLHVGLKYSAPSGLCVISIRITLSPR